MHAMRSEPIVTWLGDARRCLGDYAQRNAEQLAALDPNLPVAKSDWTVGETAAHLIFALRAFTASAAGDLHEWDSIASRIPTARSTERIAALNRVLIPAEPRRDRATAARAVTDGARAFLTTTTALPADQAVPTPWYGNHASLTVAQATCLLLGEQIMHGYDIARSTGRTWPISRADALLVFQAVRPMLPKMADPSAIGGARCNYELRLGGGERFAVAVADGEATVFDPPYPTSKRVQCHVLADPVALLKVGYGRSTQWREIARFKMITWGTKPWMAFRLPGFFSHP